MHDENSWHLDKKVPISIVFALIVQSITFIVIGTSWKTTVDDKFTAVDTRLTAAESNVRDASSDNKSQESRLIILEQNIGYVKQLLDEVRSDQKILLHTVQNPPAR